MGIYVKDMDMPERCKKCDFLSLTRFCPVCQRLKKRTDSKAQNVRPDCPLTEVTTPHGRLIDADKLLESFREALNEDRHFVNYFALVDEAPTVVEAEE